MSFSRRETRGAAAQCCLWVCCLRVAGVKKQGGANASVGSLGVERLLADSQEGDGTPALQLQGTLFCQQPEWTLSGFSSGTSR